MKVALVKASFILNLVWKALKITLKTVTALARRSSWLSKTCPAIWPAQRGVSPARAKPRVAGRRQGMQACPVFEENSEEREKT